MSVIKTRAFASEGARYIAEAINSSIRTHGHCVLCLAGGKTPVSVYSELIKSNIPWQNVYIAFGDERNVLHTDQQSNYAMALESLLKHISPAQIIRMQTELGLEQAARTYEQELLNLKTKLNRNALFDLVLLGIGSDGHTASLFPGTNALKETERLVVANNVPQLNTQRITLTYPAIHSSEKVILLVNDPAKTAIMQKIWAGGDFPATHARPHVGEAVWIVGDDKF